MHVCIHSFIHSFIFVCSFTLAERPLVISRGILWKEISIQKKRHLDTNYSLICFNKSSCKLTFCLANRFFGGENDFETGRKGLLAKRPRLPDIFAWSSRLGNQLVHNIHSQAFKCLRCCFFPTSIKSSSRAGEQACLASWHTIPPTFPR